MCFLWVLLMTDVAIKPNIHRVKKKKIKIKTKQTNTHKSKQNHENCGEKIPAGTLNCKIISDSFLLYQPQAYSCLSIIWI